MPARYVTVHLLAISFWTIEDEALRSWFVKLSEPVTRPSKIRFFTASVESLNGVASNFSTAAACVFKSAVGAARLFEGDSSFDFSPTGLAEAAFGESSLDVAPAAEEPNDR